MSLGFISNKKDVRASPSTSTELPPQTKTKSSFLKVSLLISTIALCIIVAQIVLNFTDYGYYLWSVPLILSFCNLFLILPFSPTWTFTAKDAPYIVVYNPVVLALSVHLNVAIDLFVAYWFSMWLLIALIPLLRNDMVKYELDTMKHSLSSMSLYSIIRALSAYFVTLGLPLSVSDIIPFFIANVETLYMCLTCNQSYTFGARSTLFFHYAIFKAAFFLALPQFEKFTIDRLRCISF